MAFKLFVIAAVLAITNAVPVQYHAAAPVSYSAGPAHYAATPVAHAYAPAKILVEEHTTPKNYAFEYVVNDPHKHDFHTRKEERKDGVVKGSYSLIDTDGSRRTVEYTADPHTGFHAVVHTEPGVAPAVEKVAAPVQHVPIQHAAPSYHGGASYYTH